MMKKRNIFLVYLFTFLTLGVYGIFWKVSTKNEMNSLGANIPTAWLLIIPFVNIYWMYKYCDGFGTVVTRNDDGALWFVVYFFAGIIIPGVVQHHLNKLA